MARSGQYGGGATPAPGLAARIAALRLLDAVLRQGQTLDAVVVNATRALASHEDRALALTIASEALRRLPDLDALIDSATPQAIPADAKARSVLRIALVQALAMRVPPHAAIATALPLTTGGPRRLVHGVFGTLMRTGAVLPEVPAIPGAIAKRWAHWGAAMLDDAAHALATPPLLDLTLRDPHDDAGLGGESLAAGHVRLPRGMAIADVPGFADGTWWVQNLAASVPARLLGQGGGRAALDLCAAPGGKTMQLAAQGWAVTAVDSHAGRIGRLRDNLARTRLAADIVHADIMDWEPSAPVDAVLLDAPCTATGTFARHPDVLHRIGTGDIAALSALQGRMLARAIGWLKPGGRLVYATCSLERAEGEGVIEASGLDVDPVQPSEMIADLNPQPEGWLRILPHGGLDGFFVCRLKAG